MGESDRYMDYRQQRARRRFTLGQDGNAVVALFALNVIFFLVLLVIKVGYNYSQKANLVFFNEVMPWMQLPASPTKLSERPWTLLTYMFTDMSLWRIASNMLWLWAFGSIIQDNTGNRKLVPIYIYSGLAGGIFFMIANYVLPSLRPFVADAGLLGANAAVMGLAVAGTALIPRHKIFPMLRGGIPLWILTAVYVAIDVAGVVGSNPAYAISHLAGAAAGLGFVLLLRKGYDGSIWMNNFYDWSMNLFNPNKKVQQPTVKETVFYNAANRAPYTKQSIITQDRVDAILDKISQKGYAFLTDEEKKILKKASEEDL